MITKVYTFRKVRISNDAAAECFAEIERGRSYYNRMIDALNQRVQSQLEWIRALSVSDRFLARLAVAWPWFDASLAQQQELDSVSDCEVSEKSKQCLAIYALIARSARDVRAELSASKSGCYTGTYHAVQAAFDQAVSSKRKGIWPSTPYGKRYPGSGGEMVGVHIQGGTTTWLDLCNGRSSLFAPRDTRNRVGSFSIKISKEKTIDGRVWWLCRGKNPRVIPDGALISHVMLCLDMDYGTAPVDRNGKPRGSWILRITAKLPDRDIVVNDRRNSIGVSIGWSREPSGLLVAVTSEGQELRIPRYALEKIDSEREICSKRDQLANAVKEYLPVGNPEWLPKSAIATALYIEKHGLNVRDDIDIVRRELFIRFLAKETELRRTGDHNRRRYLDIRAEYYRRFVRSLNGALVFLDKLEIKQLAELKEEKEGVGATSRFLAGANSLVALLMNAGAELVPYCGDNRESSGQERVPTQENAKKILDVALSGKRHQRTARRQVRKYRRKKKNSGAGHDAPTMAS